MILDNSLLLFSLYLSIRVFPLPRLSSSPASLTLFKYFGSAGIFTCYPSATLFSLTLGPDLPWADEPSPGNLRLSTAWILTMLSLLIPAFSLLSRPHVLSIMLHPTIECSSTAQVYLIKYISSYYTFFLFCILLLLLLKNKYTLLDILKPAISVYSLAPVIFRANSLDQ